MSSGESSQLVHAGGSLRAPTAMYAEYAKCQMQLAEKCSRNMAVLQSETTRSNAVLERVSDNLLQGLRVLSNGQGFSIAGDVQAYALQSQPLLCVSLFSCLCCTGVATQLNL